MELYLHSAIIHSVVVKYTDDSSWETYKVWSISSQTGSGTPQGEELGSVSSLECGLESPLSKAQRTVRYPLPVPLQHWSNKLVYLCLIAF